MTDLTDKWKKGELPSGYYYVKNEFGNIFPSDYSEDYDCISDTVIKDFFTEVSEIKEVLEPVPSYEEWQALLSDQLAKNEGVEINTELEAENKSLKFKIEAVRRDYASIIKHNQKLLNDIEALVKTLLKVSPEHKAWLEKNYKEYL